MLHVDYTGKVAGKVCCVLVQRQQVVNLMVSVTLLNMGVCVSRLHGF